MDEALLRNIVRQLLKQIQDAVLNFQACHPGLFAEGGARLRVVSSLAEGADRVVAEEAMELGYQMHCAMPFPKEEYEKDFQPKDTPISAPLTPSQQEFRRLLQYGEKNGGYACFEMDGNRRFEGRSYGAAARVVLHHSDILLAIWDGGPSRGTGGTVDKMREAIAFGVPVVWVDAKAPHGWQVLREPVHLPDPSGATDLRPAAGAKSSDLATIVDKQLAPPGPRVLEASKGFGPRFKMFWRMMRPHGGAAPDLREEFFSESKPKRNLAIVWDLFRSLVGDGKLKVPCMRVEDFESQVAKEWPAGKSTVTNWANLALIKHYAWADKPAEYYADRYRSSFVLAFLLGVVAVVLALLPLARPRSAVGHWEPSWNLETICPCGEIAVILFILVLVAVNWGWRWHERWIDYRVVAELVRQLRFLLPLGGGRPFPRVPSHLEGYGHPAETWMYWHVRNIEREVGLPTAKVDTGLPQEALDFVLGVQREQSAFHQANHRRSEHIEGRLHVAGYLLFIATFFVCLVHVLHVMGALPAPLRPLADRVPSHWLSLLAAVLPALGAALAGINNQGEFGRVAKRSKAMMKRLELIGKKATGLKMSQGILRSEEVLAVASELAQLMVDEVLDWRVVFTDRPPVLPG
jgi:hypothetical protein